MPERYHDFVCIDIGNVPGPDDAGKVGGGLSTVSGRSLALGNGPGPGDTGEGHCGKDAVTGQYICSLSVCRGSSDFAQLSLMPGGLC